MMHAKLNLKMIGARSKRKFIDAKYKHKTIALSTNASLTSNHMKS